MFEDVCAGRYTPFTGAAWSRRVAVIPLRRSDILSPMKRSARSESLMRQPLRMLTKALPAATKGDAAALHRARVASRRVREALPLMSSGSRGRKLERHMRGITRALGPVRELDVTFEMLDEFVASGGASHQAVSKLRRAVAIEREVRRAEMLRRLDQYDLPKLSRRALAAASEASSERESPRDAERRLARARQRQARRAGALRMAIDSAAGIYLPDRLHDVRIAIKKLRYAMELVHSLSRSRAVARLRTLRQAQDLLGRMHDLEMLIARTRTVQGSASAPNLKVSADLDRLVRMLENECRQLHGRYMASREALLKTCADAVAGAHGGRAAHAA